MKHIFCLLLCAGGLLGCAFDPPTEVVRVEKTVEGDPFRESLPQSQTFEWDAQENGAFEAVSGALLVLPKGCLVDGNGVPAEGKVELELVEGYSLADMVMGNLTTSAQGDLLETDGMFYLNATQNGRQLAVNPDLPIYMEIPVREPAPGMQLYDGRRDSLGRMTWSNPQKLERFLVPFDMELLDFYPRGLRELTEAALPILGHEVAEKAFLDSLYFNFPVGSGCNVRGESDVAPLPCGIDPAQVKAFWSAEFNGSMLATREFELRFAAVYATCRDDVLEVYVNGLDRNMWENDTAAADLLAGTEHEKVFRDFAEEKKTNVKDGGRYSTILKTHFEARLQAASEARELLVARARKLEEEAAAESLRQEYRGLLEERDGFRKKRYGFVLTDFGWKNIDRGVAEKDWDRRVLRWQIANGEDFDRLHCYIATGEPFSLHGLEKEGSNIWSTTGLDGVGIPLKKAGRAQRLTVGQKGSQWWFAESEFELSNAESEAVVLEEIEETEMRQRINAFDAESARENKVAVDLDYKAELYAMELREKRRETEQSFIQSLRFCVAPCCGNYQALFETNCGRCHASRDAPSIGPSLVGLREKRSAEWLIAFTLNSIAMIGSGDSLAVAVWENSNKATMGPMPHLLPEEVLGILDWVDFIGGPGL